MITSVRGDVRELTGFIGFQAGLTDILDWVEKDLVRPLLCINFGKSFTCWNKRRQKRSSSLPAT